jgi:hypothetical protein
MKNGMEQVNQKAENTDILERNLMELSYVDYNSVVVKAIFIVGIVLGVELVMLHLLFVGGI